MLGGLLNDALPQPVDDCLATLGHLLSRGSKYPPVIGPRWIPPLGIKSSGARAEARPLWHEGDTVPFHAFVLLHS